MFFQGNQTHPVKCPLEGEKSVCGGKRFTSILAYVTPNSLLVDLTHSKTSCCQIKLLFTVGVRVGPLLEFWNW